MKIQKLHCLLIIIALNACVYSPVHAVEVNPKKIASSLVLAFVGICLLRYFSKNTRPKRVYPKDDSFAQLAWYIFDELIVGQREKPERMGSIMAENPEDLSRFIVKYDRIDARGLIGIIDSYIKRAIIPTLTFAIAYKAFKGDIASGIKELLKILEDPAYLMEIPEAKAGKN